MKMKKILTSSALALAMMCSVSPQTVFALDEVVAAQPATYTIEENSVTFSDLDKLPINESVVATVLDSRGEEAQIGITPLPQTTWSNSQSYRVWYFSGLVNAEFYMTVTNNQVTAVFDRNITSVGGVYSEPRLTINSTKTRGQLDFTFTAVGNILKGDCWLRGEVTGINNKIKVTHRM